tara:strand:- start:8656 stop:9321 length:666 start_codon:yes stop_codon:yes gene_type:complete
MAIVPSGKLRSVFAQQFNDPMVQPQQEAVPYDGEGGVGVAEDTDAVELDQLSNEVDHELREEEAEEPGDANITKVVFDFLTQMGFEPRRLHEFKSQFVTEEGSADGESTIKVKIPDSMGNTGEAIPKSKLKGLVKGIESTAGMHFLKFRRSNKEVELDFTSSNPQDEEQLVQQDVLDEVYGTPKGSDNSLKPEAASFKEMIKENKSQMIIKILKSLGEKNA